jgi:hypothetical protein
VFGRCQGSCSPAISQYSAKEGKRSGLGRCEVCDNEYDKTFEVTMPGGDTHTFDCFECAELALAPSCAICEVRVVNQGIEVGDLLCCGSHCARVAGVLP